MWKKIEQNNKIAKMKEKAVSLRDINIEMSCNLNVVKLQEKLQERSLRLNKMPKVK